MTDPVPQRCDFCEGLFENPDDLHEEEGGQRICDTCMAIMLNEVPPDDPLAAPGGLPSS